MAVFSHIWNAHIFLMLYLETECCLFWSLLLLLRWKQAFAENEALVLVGFSVYINKQQIKHILNKKKLQLRFSHIILQKGLRE